MFSSPDTQGLHAPAWLNVIHEVNRAIPDTFGNPDGVGNVADVSTGTPGRYIEDYPTALVIMPPEADRFTADARVLVIGKTPEVEAAINAAVKLLDDRARDTAATQNLVADMERDGLL